MNGFGFGFSAALGTLLNQTPDAPIIPGGTPTDVSNVTDTSFDVISSVATEVETVVTLEYGTATGVYTDEVTADESPVSGTGDVNFSLTGLTPFTDYYFRVKAVSAGGTAYSLEFVQKTTEPAIISDGNTVAWYDFATGITKDGSNFVSAWNSRIGSNHLAQATGTNQPLHTSNGVLFDGIDNFMKTAAFTFNQPAHIFLVVKQKTWTASDRISEGIADNRALIYQSGVSGDVKIYAGGAGISAAINTALDAKKIIEVQFNGASSRFRVNKGSWTNATQAGTGNPGGITLGSNAAGSTGYGNIEYSEAIYRSALLSDADSAKVNDYLIKKYGIS